MDVFRMRTETGSLYVVGPSPERSDRIRVARIAGSPVRGTAGPATFAADFAEVQLVAANGTLRLRCTHDDGTSFKTSPIIELSSAALDDLLAEAS